MRAICTRLELNRAHIRISNAVGTISSTDVQIDRKVEATIPLSTLSEGYTSDTKI